MDSYISHCAFDTLEIGRVLGRQLLPNSIVCFYGDLGAGKTTFIKGLAESVLGNFEEEITSPTFTYLNSYQGKIPLYHFDLYRLADVDEFLSMGFDELFDAGGVCCIEWAEKLSPLQLDQAVCVNMKYLGNEERQIEIYTAHGHRISI